MKKITLLIIMLLAFDLCFGQSIFDNPITGTNPNDDNPYTTGQTVDPNITVSGIGRGPGATGRNFVNEYSASSFNTASIDLTAYFEFVITPDAGNEIDFSSFVFNSTNTNQGPTTNFAVRSSLDNYTMDIGSPVLGTSTIALSASTYQNISSTITFRIYAWGASNTNGRYRISDFIFNGTVSPSSCSTTTTWTAGSWDNGAPTTSINAVITDSYDTSTNGSFSACNLIVNSSSTLTVNNGYYVEIENDAIINGDLIVETQANFVQNDDACSFTVSAAGSTLVHKQTPAKADWFYYTYWSSPVESETIDNVFPDVNRDRCFWFNAANFVDNVGNDDIDDNGDDWQYALAGNAMIPGVGYAVTEAKLFFPGATGQAIFEGPFNTGNIETNISLNATNTGTNWNFIGNPYPCAIDFIAFQSANSSVVDGAAYFWSQSLPPDMANPGNEVSNFNQNDYATFTVGTGGAAGASGITPNQFIPSGQGFFIAGLTTGTATFTNAMRMADATSNNQFFKNANSKKNSSNIANKLWVDLTSDNGVFNQILVGYVDGATNLNDGRSYDAQRLLTADFSAALYSSITDSNEKFAIQGKAPESLTEDEIINIGFSTNINVATIYKLSIAQFEGNFLTNNPVYVKDNLLDTLHDLSASDYTFTSEVGEFNDRFEIRFSANVLATERVEANSNDLKIIELEDNNIQFTASKNIKTVKIFDLMGRQLYQFEGNQTSETYKLSNLSSSIYIAKVTLINDATITKKAFKK